VAGTTFQVASGLAEIGPATSSGMCTVGSDDAGPACTSSSSGQAVLVALTNRADVTCATASHTDATFANLDALVLEVANENAQVTTGTYNIVSADGGSGTPVQFVQAQLATTTATCGVGLDLNATGGTITLTQIGATGVTGSYSLEFGTQGTLTGTFNLPICTPPDASTSGPGCQ
jgi:hypothetical protein